MVAGDSQPPWFQFSQTRTRRDICGRRFLRFASLGHVHGAIALVSAAMWFSGIHPLLAWAPVLYFTGIAGGLICGKGLSNYGLEELSRVVLSMDVANAMHLAVLCACQGERVLSSPVFALVALMRTLFGFLVHEVHYHLVLSTLLSTFIFFSNQALFDGNSLLLVVVAALLLELSAIVVLADGPCCYEEAIMHLAQCRSQHQLLRSEALQRIDFERERFSGQLLAVATEGVAELTAAVQRASEPVLQMLKASCTTGTKSVREAERIGNIGEELKTKVSEILRYKSQVTWGQLQGHAKARVQWLREHADDHQASADVLLGSIREDMGETLAQMHELELDAEVSLDQIIHNEASRSMETAHARMDLVRQSANGMEQRISDTVEVLLSLLQYFGSKGCHQMDQRHVAIGKREEPQRCLSRRERQAKKQPQVMLPVISERLDITMESASQANSKCEVTAQGCFPLPSKLAPAITLEFPSSSSSTAGSEGSAETSASTRVFDVSSVDGTDSCLGSVADGSTASELGLTCRSDSVDGEDVASTETGSVAGSVGTTCSSAGLDDTNRLQEDSESFRGDLTEPQNSGTTESRPVAVAPRTHHPVFSTRLSYRTDNFFWSWASSRDFRAEADAMRVWQRASTASGGTEGKQNFSLSVGAESSINLQPEVSMVRSLSNISRSDDSVPDGPPKPAASWPCPPPTPIGASNKVIGNSWADVEDADDLTDDEDREMWGYASRCGNESEALGRNRTPETDLPGGVFVDLSSIDPPNVLQ